MNLTNHANLPDAIVSAVQRDPYTRGDGRISVTGLISPPRQRVLLERHDAALSEDTSDRIWSLLGQAIHVILERADDPTALRELRLSTTVRDWRVSGAFDRHLLDEPSGLLTDYKVTSAYAIRDGVKPEWTAQLNCYAHLLRLAGSHVERAEIVAVLRDWSRAQAKRGGDYPQTAVAVLPVPLWPDAVAAEYVAHRVALHQEAEHLADDALPLCTAEERWATPDQWAHMREGQKRAVRLYATRPEADAAMRADTHKKPAYVERRPGESKRCLDYCAAAPVCSQARVMANGTGEEGAN